MSDGRVYPIPFGWLSRRVHGAEVSLRERAASARADSYVADNRGETHLAASLRGKAIAYMEAADMIRALDRGRPLPKRRSRLRDTT